MYPDIGMGIFFWGGENPIFSRWRGKPNVKWFFFFSRFKHGVPAPALDLRNQGRLFRWRAHQEYFACSHCTPFQRLKLIRIKYKLGGNPLYPFPYSKKILGGGARALAPTTCVLPCVDACLPWTMELTKKRSLWRRRHCAGSPASDHLLI